MGNMIIPFIMLLIVTIALVLERKYHEDKIIDEYDEKFEEWKKHSSANQEEKKCKELVGLVFLEDSKLNIQVLDQKIIDKLERKKYSIKI
jgi:hypothetical protein